MDPLSVTAGTIAFISAANTLLLLCYKVRTILKGPQEALKKLIREITDLRNLVENIQKLTLAVDEQQRNPTRAATPNTFTYSISAPLQECMTELRTLDRKLRVLSDDSSQNGDSKLRNIVQAVKWTSNQEAVQISLVNIERYKSAMMLGLDSYNMSDSPKPPL